MDSMYKSIYKLILGPKYTINDLDKKIIVVDSLYKCVSNSLPAGYNYKYYYNGEFVGILNFRSNGQIGLIMLNREFQGWGIGADMLLETNIIKKDKLWCVTSKGHPFWSSRKNAVWKDPIHDSVTSGGYEFEL